MCNKKFNKNYDRKRQQKHFSLKKTMQFNNNKYSTQLKRKNTHDNVTKTHADYFMSLNPTMFIKLKGKNYKNNQQRKMNVFRIIVFLFVLFYF